MIDELRINVLSTLKNLFRNVWNWFQIQEKEILINKIQVKLNWVDITIPKCNSLASSQRPKVQVPQSFHRKWRMLRVHLAARWPMVFHSKKTRSRWYNKATRTCVQLAVLSRIPILVLQDQILFLLPSRNTVRL